MEKKNHIQPFELSIPGPGSENTKDETITAEVLTTDDILVRPGDGREALRKELRILILKTFPKLSKDYRDELVSGYFDRTGNGFLRYVFLLRNQQAELIASAMFDYGQFEYERKPFRGIYSILRVVSPDYEGLGLAQHMAVQEFMRFSPDVLFSTSYQSAALHSWIRLYEKGLITGYEVFPRLEQKNGEEILITVPFRELDFAVKSFLLSYRGFAQNEDTITRAIRNLTVFLARKNAHGEAYEHPPWEKDGRKDALASKLGLGDQDAMLVMFRKII